VKASEAARRAEGVQKSAEAKVAVRNAANGPNIESRTGARHSMCEEDVVSRVESPSDPEAEGGGTAQATGFDRQAHTACEDQAGDETQ
jgi:hypothetical protein